MVEPSVCAEKHRRVDERRNIPIGQIPATGAEAVRRTIMQMLKNPTFRNR